MSQYPLQLINERTLPSTYDGPVFIWDVDKTYLDTDFKSLVGLLRIPLEMAIDKRAIPGTAALLRECRMGPSTIPRQTPIYFVSASPPQLAAVIRRKMLLDGLQPDGFVFKDQLRLALRGRLGQLKHQVEYKLTAHFGLIAALPPRAGLVLVGDDWESDAQVFSLLDSVQRGDLEGDRLGRALDQAGVRERSIPDLLGLSAKAAGRANVSLAVVLLTRGRDPGYARPFAPPVQTARESLQAAAIFHAAGLVSLDGVVSVARHLQTEWGWVPERVSSSLGDLEARSMLPNPIAKALRSAVSG